MTSCDEIRISLGALAVSALDPDEERQVREHVAGCDRCAGELAELTGTVDLLAMAKPLDLPAAVQPDRRVLDGLLAAVREDRRRARRRRFALGLAAAAAGAVLAGTAAVLIDDPAPAADEPVPTAEVRGSEGAVVLEVELFEKGWGTAVRGAIAGVPPGSTCSLVAVGADGSRQVAATWTVPAEGYDPATGKLWFDGGVGLQPHEVSQYEIVTTEGDVLVVAPA